MDSHWLILDNHITSILFAQNDEMCDTVTVHEETGSILCSASAVWRAETRIKRGYFSNSFYFYHLNF